MPYIYQHGVKAASAPDYPVGGVVQPTFSINDDNELIAHNPSAEQFSFSVNADSELEVSVNGNN